MSEKLEIHIDVARELVDYDPLTGRLTWKPRRQEFFATEQAYLTWNNRFSSKEAFSTVTTGGYLQGRLLYRKVQAHVIAWFLHYGNWPDCEIDHINHNRMDNRISNLREVTSSANKRNSTKRRDNISGVVGVFWHKVSGKWCAFISADNSRMHLGLFDRLEDAVSARKSAEGRYGYHTNHGKPRFAESPQTPRLPESSQPKC